LFLHAVLKGEFLKYANTDDEDDDLGLLLSLAARLLLSQFDRWYEDHWSVFRRKIRPARQRLQQQRTSTRFSFSHGAHCMQLIGWEYTRCTVMQSFWTSEIRQT